MTSVKKKVEEIEVLGSPLKRQQRIVIASIWLVFAYVTWPLLQPIAMGGIIAAACYPAVEIVAQRIYSLARLHLPDWLSALLVTIGLTMVILVPVTLVIVFGAQNALVEFQSIRNQISDQTLSKEAGSLLLNILQDWRLNKLARFLSKFLPIQGSELVEWLRSSAARLESGIYEFLTAILKMVPQFLFSLGIIVIASYAFLVGRKKINAIALQLSPFPPQTTQHVLSNFVIVCKTIVLASLFSGLVQASIMAMVCVFLQIRNIPLVALLVFLFSFLPIIGTAPVTLGLATILFMKGNLNHAIIIGIAALFIGFVDNMIRPLFLHGRAKLNFLIAFFAALGGIQMLGFLGLFLGPVIAQLALTLLSTVVREKSFVPVKLQK